jgi:hypothetical protein
MPYVTWCLTGPLTFLPVHAAGLYDTKDAPKIFDYVVSSYAPTLSSLLAAKRRPLKSDQTARRLNVSQPATPGLNPLPGTVDELDTIQTFQSPIGRLHITRLDVRRPSLPCCDIRRNAAGYILPAMVFRILLARPKALSTSSTILLR